MEEKILEILQKSIYYSEQDVTVKSPLNKTAKEITSLIMGFIEWLIHNTMEATTYSLMVYLKYQTKDEIIKHGGQYFDLSREWHIKELFDYWLNNIKNR